MKNKIVLILISIVMILGLGGCYDSSKSYELQYKGNWGSLRYYYDTIHEVGIWWSESGGLAVLPRNMITDPEKEISEKPIK